MKPHPLRVADRGRLPLAPERAHLGPVIHMSVGDDCACGLDELPMPEHLLWPCPRFVLVSSVLTPEGPNYRIIEAFPLSA